MVRIVSLINAMVNAMEYILSYLVIGILLLLFWTRNDNERYEEYLCTCVLVVLVWPVVLWVWGVIDYLEDK